MKTRWCRKWASNDHTLTLLSNTSTHSYHICEGQNILPQKNINLSEALNSNNKPVFPQQVLVKYLTDIW